MEATAQRTDLRDIMERLCEVFGLKYNRVTEITITPRELHAVELLENENGHAFLNDEREIASRTVSFPIET